MGIEVLKSLLLRFASAVPNILGAFMIAFIGFLVAKAVAKILERVLKTIGIDKAASKLNEIDVLQQYNLQFSLSKIISQVVYYFLLLIFLAASTDVLQMPAVSQLIMDLLDYIPRIIVAMIVLSVGLLIANILKKAVYTTCKSVGIPSPNLIANFLFYFIFLTALISALSQAQVDTDFVKSNINIILGGGVAAFALGYGLASKEMMTNFLASFYSRRHFSVGDTVKIGDTIGKIVFEDNTCLKIQTGERLIVIPLSKLMSQEVEILPNDYLQLNENQ